MDAQEACARGSSSLFPFQDRDFENTRRVFNEGPPFASSPIHTEFLRYLGPSIAQTPLFFLFPVFLFSIPSPTPPYPILYYRGRALTTPRGPVVETAADPLIEDSSKQLSQPLTTRYDKQPVGRGIFFLTFVPRGTVIIPLAE